jgi:hypothetical protein
MALIFLTTLMTTLGSGSNLFAQWFMDFENGLAASGYNDVAIPRLIWGRPIRYHPIPINRIRFLNK